MNYWAERAATTMAALTDVGIEEIEEQLIKYYGRSMDSIIGQFETVYNKVLLSMDEGKTPTPADLYKLDAYWKMIAQVREELQKLGEKEKVLMSKVFAAQYQNIYSIALPGDSTFTTIDAAAAQQMINSIWCADGLSWSERIWKNTELLHESLNEGLIECVVTGKKTTDLKNLLQERFDVSYRRADTLVRTEMAHIQTSAAQQRYNDYGIKQVEILADKDERRCEYCGKLHKKRYPINAVMPIPAHPNCRCAIVPVVDID